MAGEIVHDDDVAWPELGDEHLLDVGLEGVAVDRAVEHQGRDNAVEAQAGDEGRGLPVAVRNAGEPAFTMLTTAPSADVEPYHDRQVAVLRPEDWIAWLYLTKPEAELLRPLPEGSLDVETVAEGE